jgi:hypothetical protein
MKRLLVLTSNEQQRAIRELLELHGIEVLESESNFLDQASFWVKDEDYSKAKELVDARAAFDGREARLKVEREWRQRWGASYVRWFTGTIRENPWRVVRLILLIVLLWLFLLYPLWTSLRPR